VNYINRVKKPQWENFRENYWV